MHSPLLALCPQPKARNRWATVAEAASAKKAKPGTKHLSATVKGLAAEMAQMKALLMNLQPQHSEPSTELEPDAVLFAPGGANLDPSVTDLLEASLLAVGHMTRDLGRLMVNLVQSEPRPQSLPCGCFWGPTALPLNQWATGRFSQQHLANGASQVHSF
ncbi:hypothetical protein SKAU_G00252600 [Synaphobranchus kaupii]|uniref:Uncharacterized protein n=1 Tax=Synaphobranchus kaupii TaxID=118154 RepID=A0A9Q1F356_SYNKA|nr:hypothetical protein SKAU_G00252600 [Synaphobranchus kaupii]